MGDAAAQLAKLADYDAAYAAFAERIVEAKIIAEEAARDLRSHAARIESDPRRLDALIERSEELKRLRRKHGDSIDEVLACADALRRELAELEGAEEHGQRLAERYEAAVAKAFKLARRLSKARRTAAGLLERCVESELGDLNMARTEFVVRFAPATLPDEPGSARVGARGFDEIEFLISPNPGEEPKPLAKIASGGELSRVMLVMKSALLDRDLVGTYVFDEVDTGIGGATADRVGQKIGRAAGEHQVLCITHLAQIASIADHHYSVEKGVVAGRTQSTIRPLSEPERVAEIARMLGGTRVTDTTIEAARELISVNARI